MPFSAEDQDEIIALVEAYLATKKKRIPELPPNTDFGDLSLLDEIPVWMNANNNTVHASLLIVKSLLTTGGTGTIAPVEEGPIITHVITADEAGDNTISVPEIAGKSFYLRLEGRPVLPTEFEILSGGGFKIKDVLGSPYEFTEGQRFDLQLYSLTAVPAGGPASLSSSYITGFKEVSANTTLNATNDANKVISIRAALNIINIILPSLASTPENAIFLFESQINNTKQAGIYTTGSENIYMNNTSFTELHIGKGEVLALLRKSDGWLVINDFGEIYKDLGVIYPVYAVGADDNRFLCDGSDVLKIDAPRLWEKVQTLGPALTSDAGVYAANPGMWLHKDTATFSLPDLRGLFLRGAVGETPGTFQDEMVKAQTFTVPQVQHNASGVPVGVTDGPLGGPGSRTYTVGTGTETRPKSTLIQWVVKY